MTRTAHELAEIALYAKAHGLIFERLLALADRNHASLDEIDSVMRSLAAIRESPVAIETARGLASSLETHLTEHRRGHRRPLDATLREDLMAVLFGQFLRNAAENMRPAEKQMWRLSRREPNGL